MDQRYIAYTLFGATGDLAKRKIIPALLNLYLQKKISEQFTLIAFSRRDWGDEEYRNFVTSSLEEKISGQEYKNFLNHIVYVQGNFDDEKSYERLANKLQEIDTKNNVESEKLFHLAIQPEFYEQVALGLANVKLCSSNTITCMPKFLIEKPFGRDLGSAEKLESALEKEFKPEQIYRIDHYLGKLGLWNILETQKKDKKLESLLNNQHVASVHIKIFEEIGIEGRGEFYDTVGALRDVVQNHALEMLAVALSDASAENSTEKFIKSRVEILENLKPATSVIKAQYEGYLDEQDVPKDSQTETYVKITTEIETKRWQGTPIILEAGKALNKKESSVTFNFKDSAQKIFNIEETENEPGAYEVIIEQAIHANKKYFVDIQEVYAAWRFVTPILENLPNFELKKYKQESPGPT